MHNEADCGHWYGLKFPDLDTPNWLPYLEAEVIGQDPASKLTIDFMATELIPPLVESGRGDGQAA